ncbi:MAG: hypothetical protein JNM42_03705 [Propionivibrio sp.]|uniref:hypothetical protein n=1 Tax=Propionivibrio sp. TaxID=2212460 RepID=UPI001A4C82BD|nr:hypothetical protein [Propionivibrio sp.]MBL8413524.1 hypothetical protein [Propionivibrio sp.]
MLSNIRSEGNWEAWISFLLEGVCSAADEAERSIGKTVRIDIYDNGKGGWLL